VQLRTDVAQHKDLLELPRIVINSKQLPPTFLSVGDRVPLSVQSHTWLSNISGTSRIEQMDVSVDDNHFETISLTLDNYGL